MDPAKSSPSNPGSSPLEPEHAPSSTSPNREDQPTQPPKKATTRKRTKTGCLTCRRRRIKCDEGKPTCNNCIKSKRNCEGYSQRLTFKEPLGSFPSGHLYGHPVYHPQTHDTFFGARTPAAQIKAPPSSQAPLAVIAPKPPPADYSSGAGSLQFRQEGYGPPSTAGGSSYTHAAQLPGPSVLGPDSGLVAEHLSPSTRRGSLSLHGESPFGAQATVIQGFGLHPTMAADAPPVVASHHALVPGPGRPLVGHHGGAGTVPQPMDGERDYWQSDDEASMADSGDEDAQPDPHLLHLESNDPGIEVARRLEPHHDLYGVRIRSFGGIADQNILDTYAPSSASSPLNDSQTATVFWYFVNVTGQSMSLYERHPFGPTPIFHGHPVPKQRQHIWTYTFPIMAFNHPALMQAMLALGSLQMAKLQGSPPTAAMKHYHLSLRRIAKNYQSPLKRTQPATLAATLLLGFYEVWNSDHDKWCKHLWGARAVLRDIPLRQQTCDVLTYKRRRWQQLIQGHQCSETCFASHGDLGVDPGTVDTELIFQLSGQRVSYDTGHSHAGDSTGPTRVTERDVEKYEQMRDLYWWYCKMDVYQSFLGGTRPL
ncbi:hypothetical protein VTH06DRAFT_1981 [Thermothelomyces fergusii]